MIIAQAGVNNMLLANKKATFLIPLNGWYSGSGLINDHHMQTAAANKRME
ncbi:hypothetical protein AM1BK_48260 [Neobacillus kokaensis]|uniref:Uncharacterized protein n=1 Tax=Neobacillus kokaensis TaxID=2759023 RepID=A0ABQ3NBK3_9BACI|nr:hypothetical protein AM1BK_48260 [Neobacillus kokaensis]